MPDTPDPAVAPRTPMQLLWLLGLAAEAVAGGERPPRGLTQPRGEGQPFPLAATWNSSSGLTAERLTLLRFVSDVARRDHWEVIVFFFSGSSEFSNRLSPLVYNFFNAKGIFVSLHTTTHPLLPQSLLHHRHHLGVVYLCDPFDDHFLAKVSDLDLFDAYRSWLIIRPDTPDTRLDDALRNSTLGLVANLVVATLERRPAPTSAPTEPPTEGPPATVPTGSEGLVGFRKREVGPEGREREGEATVVVRLEQVYKASAGENETLSVEMGMWDVPNGMVKVKGWLGGERRRDLGGYKVSVGVKNSTHERGGGVVVDRFSFESEADEESRFLELLDCLMFGMNASSEVLQFEKLGWRNEEGGWTHLLGAVVDGTVDFALETINPNADKTRDMAFTYAIVITMNNIYFRRPKSGGLRDIFMAPFSPRLLLCVFGTSLLLTGAMVAVTVVGWGEGGREEGFEVVVRGRERRVVVRKREERRWELSEAALWSVSVMCMQGSQWSPKCMSGSLLLINSLLFALIIYNSFAAFITSVLSVKDVKIKNLKDLTGSDFAFGYTLGDADELFLRTVNDTLLRELYFKGLRENDGVGKAVEGMQRAARGKYAFFVGARTARRALRTVIAHDKRCEFQELYLPVTKSFASIPVTRKSSLKKILNYRIICLMETGILQRFQRLILPSMPRCVEKTAFNSARLTDVYSAFFVLVVGWIASVVVLLGEIVWHRRKRMKAKACGEKMGAKGFVRPDGFSWLK